jgi:hypothetical protein
MFEKTFLPYALNKYNDLTCDPIDCCVKEKIQSVIEVRTFYLILNLILFLYDRKFLNMILTLFLIMIFGQHDDRK